jgi:regulator of sirC expression with transglutaminase-like and TPR domain
VATGGDNHGNAGSSGNGEKAAIALLEEIGRGPEDGIDLAAAALALARLDRPRVALDHYEGHLDDLAEAAEKHFARAGDPAAALSETIAGAFRYEGDRLTYDDLQNANLMRVIDRRRGLPIALGILYIHTGRRLGWDVCGLAFPGHFLIRLDSPHDSSGGGARSVLDPFNDGRHCGAGEMRELLKLIGGAGRELRPEDYAPVSDREILLRLQNNIKLRHMQMRDAEGALRTIGRMLLFAPDLTQLWWETAALNLESGNLQAATQALEEFMAREDNDAERHRAAALMQRIRGKLN